MTVLIKSGNEPIPGYRLENRLGTGAFGEVWKARAPGGTYVALKFLQLSGKQGAKEFRAIQRVKQIRHPNLMPITQIWLLDDDGQIVSDDLTGTWSNGISDTVTEPSKATLVIEPVRDSRRPALLIIGNLLADKTLTNRLQECRDQGHAGIPVRELLGYMDEAAKGLDYLNSNVHQIGDSHGAVQHCDVKPDNIVLTGGSAVVTDFGVAQMLAEAGSGATATSLGGTPAYMAPECFSAKTSSSTDQYALAVTYYELRAGVLPFAVHTYSAVYEAHKSGKLDFKAIPPGEQAVLRKATSPDPARRYGSCVDFVEALREAAAPKSKAAKAKAREKWRVVAPAAAVMGAIALAVVAVMAVRGGGSSGDGVESIVDFAHSGKLDLAIPLVAELKSVDDVKAGVRAIQEGFEGRREKIDDALLAKCVDLLAFLGKLDAKGELSENDYGSLRGQTRQALKQLLGEIDTLCDQWNPTDDSEPSATLADRVKRLEDLLAFGASANVKECFELQPTLDLHKLRIEARRNKSGWQGLRQPLVEVAQNLPAEGEKDAINARALAFIFGESGANRQAVEEALRQYQGLLTATIAMKPAAWEQQQVENRVKAINKVISPEWLSLSDENFAFIALVGGFSEQQLPKSVNARNPAANSLELARSARTNGELQQAREYLHELRKGKPEGQLAKDITVEEIATDLVDPDAPPSTIHKWLAESPDGDFETLAEVVKAIDGGAKPNPDSADRPRIDSQRAALLDVLRWECQVNSGGSDADALLSDPAAVAALRRRISQTEFADYGLYVEGLALSRSAKADDDAIQRARLWRDASVCIREAVATLSAGSLLTADFRMASARDILTQAVVAWSNRVAPADKDFGTRGVFGERAEDAFQNLLVARRLDKQGRSERPVPAWRDALLLAAAAANWNEERERYAEELRAIAEALRASDENSASLKGLPGTIEFVAARSRLATDPRIPDALPLLAGSLEKLYLKDRLTGEYDAKPPALERLQAISSAVIEPARSLADAFWEQFTKSGLDAASTAHLATYYQAAGLLLRDLDAVEGFGSARNEAAYQSLARANRLSPEPTALIEQGQSLERLGKRPVDFAEQINAIADRAIELSAQSRSLVQRRALALQAFARLARARSELRSAAQRNDDRAQALTMIDQALAAPSGTQGSLPPESSDWLITRSAINIEVAYHGDLDFAARKERLVTAVNDARRASLVPSNRHPEYAYLAWGNALEDLAYYVLDDPAANYDAACKQFLTAIDVSKPAELGAALLKKDGQWYLRYAKHLPAHLNLLRCRIRWSRSGAHERASEGPELLERAIADATGEFPSLDVDAPTAANVDHYMANQVAELLFWLSEANGHMARLAPENEPQAKLQQCETQLTQAIAWTEHSGSWEPWATYKHVLAHRKAAQGDRLAAIAHCEDVLRKAREPNVALSPASEFAAARELVQCRYFRETRTDGTRGDPLRPLENSEWDALISRFPANDSLAACYHAGLRLIKIHELGQWNQRAFDELDALVRQLEAASPHSERIAQLRLDMHLLQATRNPQFAGKNVEAAKNAGAVLGRIDEFTPEAASLVIKQLKSGAIEWKNVKPEWLKRKVVDHLIATREARKLVLESATAAYKAEQGDEALRELGTDALNLMVPEISRVTMQAGYAQIVEQAMPMLREYFPVR